MKRISIALLSALACLMLLTACNTPKGDKIAVIDEETAFRDNNAAREAMAYLQKKGKPLQDEAQKAMEAVQKEQTPENTKAYKDAVSKLQTVMGAEQQRIVADLSKEFTAIIEKIRTEKGVTIVISKANALAFDATTDITQDVIKAMDKVTLKFDEPAVVQENDAKKDEKKAE